MSLNEARPARFADIPYIIALGKKCHESSRLFETTEIVEDAARNFLFTAIKGHSTPASLMSMSVFVTNGMENEPWISGVIIGLLQPRYFVMTEAVVTDLIWYVDPDMAHPRAGANLLHAMHEWADTFEDGPVARVHCVNDAVMNPRVTGRMFRMAGYKKTGEIYEKEAEQ
ncbi:hypothetical protein [Roseovarius sp.]|uniref:hypothetical protein n=1 Tax=Roseovarius sp. TaxID=1486281 RepID=UPI003BAB341F